MKLVQPTPARLGRYHVIGKLASGGMAELFLCKLFGPSGFQRLVVIKRILPHLAERPSFINMFLDEARICANVRHNNVVQVHELCQDADGLYIVMEYLEGESLANVLRRLAKGQDRLHFGLVAHVIAEACAGLHAAHELKSPEGEPYNVVHRDISPDNLFVTFSGEVKVLDFGIAKAAGRSAQTQTGNIKGKFSYMSPEQSVGAELDRRSDLFSLGIVLYELSTIRRLFKRASDLMVLKALCELDIVPPSTGFPDYPEALERVCLRALQRGRTLRYQSAADLRSDLFPLVREFGISGDPKAALSKMMHETFSDRIEEQRILVSSIESGMEEVALPVGEIDIEVVIPSPHEGSDELKFRQLVIDGAGKQNQPMDRADTIDERAMPPAAAQPSNRRSRYWFPLALCAFVGIAGYASRGIWAEGNRGGSDKELDTQSDVALGTISLDAASALAVRGEADATRVIRHTHHTVSISSEPQGAKVSVDGHFHGLTPLEVKFPSSKLPLAIQITKGGYLAGAAEIVPTKDHQVKLVLLAEKRSSGKRRKNTKPKESDNSFHRFD